MHNISFTFAILYLSLNWFLKYLYFLKQSFKLLWTFSSWILLNYAIMIMNKKNPEWTETINYNALEDKIDNKK